MRSRQWATSLAVAAVSLVLAAPLPGYALPPQAQEGEPTPSPTDTTEPPAPTPTAEPEPTAEPTPEPTAEPTAEPPPPAEPPPSPAPSPSESSPPSSAPSPGSPPATAGPDAGALPVTPPAPGSLSPFDPVDAAAAPGGAAAAATPHDLQEVTRAVVTARSALDAARTELAAARAAAALAHDALAESRAADEQIRRDLAVAAQAEARAERRLGALRLRVAETRRDLGAVAAQAYRGTDFATLSVVLDATTPAEFADAYVGMRAVLRSGDGVLGALAADVAVLAEEQARRQAARELQVRLQREAEAALAAAETAAETARGAEEHLADVVDRHEAALVAAEEARLADVERHQAFLAQSSAVGATILDWAARLSAGAGSVAGTGDFVRPGTGPITSRFGPRLHPVLGYVKLHTGIDLGAGDGWVHAADAGTVVVAGSNPAYGLMTVVDHGDFGGRRLATLYAHQSVLLVGEGDAVAPGQRIGRIGSTGYSTGPHLHFEVRLDGQAVDPGPWVATARPAGR